MRRRVFGGPVDPCLAPPFRDDPSDPGNEIVVGQWAPRWGWCGECRQNPALDIGLCAGCRIDLTDDDREDDET